MTDEDEIVEIYTDGACRGNPGVGGWGALLRFGDVERAIKGAERETTNNRMELTAAIEALAALNRKIRVNLYTDSKYVKNGITQWLPQWRSRNWKTASKKPVKNVDLWQRLEQLAAEHDVHWSWVRGHAGDPGNEAADRLANEAIDDLIDS
ncbi:MAG: ribonuclease HI [Gammaproteobacteria bacterium]|nr:ribonuclease HI [Gammaproteobacteria bacterium]